MSEYNSENKSIRIGENEFGFPLYWTKDDLIKRISDAEKDYHKDDIYFFYEKNSVKLNFTILNDGNKFLEDVEIKFWFDKSIFNVAKEKPTKPVHRTVLQALNPINPSYMDIGYPIVIETEGHFIVESDFATVRHKEKTPVFRENLRILIPSDLKGDFPIKYHISAKNLPQPIEGELFVEILTGS